MLWSSEPRVEPGENGRVMAVVEECTLPGCRVCYQQQTLRVASPEELERQNWDFPYELDEPCSCEKIIGEGGFSIVFLENLQLQRGENDLHPTKPVVCAVKRLERAVRRGHLTKSSRMRETDILKRLQAKDEWHQKNRDGEGSSGYRYIVPYLGSYVYAGQIHIVMEYMAQSDLMHYMDIPWREHNTRIVVKQLLSGLQFLHSSGLAHRDLKPLNIFPILSHDGCLLIKIGDFGSAKISSPEDPLITTIGTWEYQAPEIFNREAYSPKVDIWSLGYLIFTLLTGKPLFPKRAAYNAYVYQPGGSREHSPRNGLDPGTYSQAAVNLVTSMLQINPDHRPSAKDALSDPWFTRMESLKVTQDLYDHFVRVHSGGRRLRRFIDVEPTQTSPPSNEQQNWLDRLLRNRGN